jgi:hypothetical protein
MGYLHANWPFQQLWVLPGFSEDGSTVSSQGGSTLNLESLGVMLMAFSDPLSVTISAVTTPLPKVNTEGDETRYQSADGLISVEASHDAGKRLRHLLRINHSKLTADPFIPAENVKVSMSNYIVFDVPPAGYTAAEQLAVYTGFKAMYIASTDLLISKLLAGES